MNPMMRWAYAIHDVKNNQLGERMQRKRDAHKVKLREEKEMRRLDAIERDNKRRTEQKSPTPEKEGEEHKMEETAACKFQKELCWCIQQLEMGLDNKKTGSQKAPEAERLLKILKSSKAPMARKRQVMRASFGNYRARMQQEEKKHSEDMAKNKSLKAVECEKMSSATFFRRATSSTSPSPHGGPRYRNVQPVIPEMSNEESETDTKEQGAHKVGSDEQVKEEEEEDVLMKSLELETMDMHLCKSDDAHSSKDAGDSSRSTDLQLDGQPLLDNKLTLNSLKRLKMEREMEEEEENEKENIPSRTPTDTDDTNHSQVSSTFSSCASLFSFNFEIKEEDLDQGSRPFTAHPPKSDGMDSHRMMRGLDNRASDSTSSSGGTPTKRASRKRNRGKRKQQQQKQNEDIQQSDSKTSSKETLLTESPKIELAAKEGFKFDFPEPVET